MDVPTFEARYANQRIKSPHGIIGQCVSVPSEFAVVNGWPELFGAGDATAYDIWRNGVNGYSKIANTPAGFPGAGDFVFFGPQYGNGAGHVILVKSANANQIVGVEQNDPMGSGVHEKVYSYYAVQGWFHHNGTVTNPAPAPKPTGFPKQVTIQANPFANVRVAPSTSAALATDGTIPQGHLANGVIITVYNQVNGQQVTANGRTSSVWFVTSHGFYISQTVTNG